MPYQGCTGLMRSLYKNQFGNDASYTFNLLTLQREVDTSQFMQTAPWLGITPGVDGQAIQFQDGEDSPIISLFKSIAVTSVPNPSFPNSSSFRVLSRQAEAAGIYFFFISSSN